MDIKPTWCLLDEQVRTNEELLDSDKNIMLGALKGLMPPYYEGQQVEQAKAERTKGGAVFYR